MTQPLKLNNGNSIITDSKADYYRPTEEELEKEELSEFREAEERKEKE